VASTADAGALALMQDPSAGTGLLPPPAPVDPGRLTVAERTALWRTWPLERPDDVLLVTDTGFDTGTDTGTGTATRPAGRGPVGYVLARCERWHAMDARVHALYVLPDHRRQGHGRALLHAAVTELWARGCGPVGLATAEDDPARGWYDLLGGVLVADEVDAVDGRQVRRVVYRWEVASELARRLAPA
jgi:GNAT superfamily N-acetyltransferase